MTWSKLKVHRRETKQVHIGSVAIGGGAPVSVQTMTKTDTRDVEATVAQVNEVATVGCDIIRIAVPDEQAAQCMPEIVNQSPIPVVADIHFDYKLALASLEAGVDGLRINPGNIGGEDNVREVVAAASERNVPIRIGVNSGSLESDIEEKYGSATAEALVESALRHVNILEKLKYEQIKISVKASDVMRTVDAYRLLSQKTGYPLHVGVTEAGTRMAGTVRSSVAMGILLAEGIGDTIRVSLTDSPAVEVRTGLELLRSLGLREPGPNVISCPTCGRTEVDVIDVAQEVEQALEQYYSDNPDSARPVVAVMGCMVNGPGEAKEADIALAGGRGKYALYVHGEHARSVAEADAVKALLEEVSNFKAKE
ncbi:4-hydroxy-3-methylbut-2-en-1-yl diphosphate synthase [bacterium E08(2017)]|nr:4-hydroxy-3-methylbut-2-en-1-yl diphosphate synthase [bacterium E08(2017)]